MKIRFALLLGLTACTGMNPGGAELGSAPAPISIGNSLDGGSSVAGDLPEDTGQGAGVPSTQQSNDGIGLPASCFTAFKIRVRVMENGEEQACIVSTNRSYGEVAAPQGLTYAPLEDLSTPLVTLTFSHRLTRPTPSVGVKSGNAKCFQGVWQTETMVFHWSCEEYRVKAQARWSVDGSLLSSSIHEETTTRKGGLEDPIPLEITVNLGSDSFNADLPQTSENSLY